VIPGQSALSFDVRGMDDPALDASLSRLCSEVERIAHLTGTTAVTSTDFSSRAVQTDPVLRSAVADAASQLGYPFTALASGAGHDAQHLARLGPIGVIFVPSVGGVSHHPAERTDPGHLVAGAEVLLATIRLADERLDP
jgi:N-carbamoyl-L-amino-acid hydrolase